MRFILYYLVVGGLLLSSSLGLCQTLEQTTAYIINGGFVDVSDMKQVEVGTVITPTYNLQMFPIPQSSFQVMDERQCVILQNRQSGIFPGAQLTWHFNNVIVSETSQQQVAEQLTKMHFNGELPVFCASSLGGAVASPPESCSRQSDFTVENKNLPRVYKAIEYLYSKFCSSAHRKNAF